MSENSKLCRPWLVAVWPGMGHVAISAGYYLIAKLEMSLLTEFSAAELFDIEHVEVSGGLLRTGHQPRSRLFVWKDPRQQHDLIVFIGEAQPPSGRYSFCRRLMEYARDLGVERVYTFAAMATQMHPEHESRVFGATTDLDILGELKRLELDLLEDGRISGLNGVLPAAAAELGIRGTCLLGEMPHIFAQFPFPAASLAVLKVFTMIADMDLDTAELAEQARAMKQKLGEILTQVEQELEEQSSTGNEEKPAWEPPGEAGLSRADQQHIEQLFEQAMKDRTTAYLLQRELDRLGVFRLYEDRFLDLFKNPE
ncbi:MAG: PAC2 family protein [Planctomycetota bacterium]